MRILVTCLVLVACSIPAAIAQNAPSSPEAFPPCNGTVAIIRVSSITSTGSMGKFMQAVAAQREWYRSHGLHDRVFASKVIVRDPSSHAWGYSDKEAISYHLFPANDRPLPAHDAGWNSFVKLFSETSTIEKSALTCLPNSMVRTPAQ